MNKYSTLGLVSILMLPSCTLFTAPVPKEQTMELREAIRQIDIALEGLDDISDGRARRGARKYGINLTEMTLTLNLTKSAAGGGNLGAGASAIPLNPGAGTVSVAFTENRSVSSSNTLVLKLTRDGNQGLRPDLFRDANNRETSSSTTIPDT